MSDERVFWVIRCPDCGKHQACWVRKVRSYTFKCRECGRSCKLWQEKSRGVRLQNKQVKGALRAAELVKKLNAKGKVAGFTTYRTRDYS